MTLNRQYRNALELFKLVSKVKFYDNKSFKYQRCADKNLVER